MKALPLQTYNSVVEKIALLHYQNKQEKAEISFVYVGSSEDDMLIGLSCNSVEYIYQKDGTLIGTFEKIRRKMNVEYVLRESFLIDWTA